MNARPSFSGARPFGPSTRQEIEEEVERLLALLDELDGDSDLEPDADGEPSLGWTKTMALGSFDDREEQVR